VLLSFNRLLKTRWRFRGEFGGLSKAQASLALILQTPKVTTESPIEKRMHAAPIGVHILAQDAHLLQALWALKSFYHFAGVRYPLTVHLQGQNTKQISSIVGEHFPQVRLISQLEANAVVEPWLEARGLHRLLAMRNQFFLMMKLIDLHLLARTPLVLYFDTDVLFFDRPRELMSIPDDLSAASHLFMRDNCFSYRITAAQAHADLGVDLHAFANGGLMRLVAGAIDLAACERFMSHPTLAQKHWHLEQTLHALNASAQGRFALLPATYSISTGPQTTPGLIARHYTTPIRHMLVEEGISHILGTGFLQINDHRSSSSVSTKACPPTAGTPA
jgi:hypothetical protein